MLPLILAGVFSLVSVSADRPSDISGVVDDIVARGNEFLTSEGYRNISLPELLNGNWFIKRHFSAGSVHDLATFRRIGDAEITTKAEGDITQYTIQTTVGLESLEAACQYDIKFLWIFETSGRMRITVNKNSALVKLVVVTDANGGGCGLISKDFDVVLLDGIEVAIEEGGFLKGFVARSVKYVLNFFLPSVIQAVNRDLDDFNQNFPISPKLTKYVCQYFI